MFGVERVACGEIVVWGVGIMSSTLIFMSASSFRQFECDAT